MTGSSTTKTGAIDDGERTSTDRLLPARTASRIAEDSR